MFSGDFTSNSSVSGLLNDHFVFKLEGFGDLFLGINQYGVASNGDKYHSDIGVVKMVHALGLLGFSIVILIYTLLIANQISNKNHYGVFLLILLIVLNFKDLYLIQPVPFFALFSYMLITSKERIKNYG